MEKQTKMLKSIFSMLLCVCIILSGVLSTTAFATDGANDAGLEIDLEYGVTMGTYTFTPLETGYYLFESTGSECDPNIYVFNDSVSVSDDDNGRDVNFRCVVSLTAGSDVSVVLGEYNNKTDAVINFTITYLGTSEPDISGDADDDYYDDDDYDDDIGDDDYDGIYIYANGFSAVVIDETTCCITDIENSTVVNGVLTIPQTISEYTVTGFDYWADLFNNSITVINLPSTVSGYLPFDSLYNLTAVNVAEGNGAYKSINGVVYNTALTEVAFIPNAFNGVFYIPAAVTNFDYRNLNATGFEIETGNQSFSMRNGILCNYDGTVYKKATPSASTEFVFKAGVQVEPACFEGSKLQKLTIESGVTGLSYAAFAGATELTAVVIPASVKIIGESAFSGCKKLGTVTLNSGLQEIKTHAFEECSALKTVSIPGTVKEIGYRAFWNCSALSKLTLASGIKKIDSQAFAECIALTSVTIPDTVTALGGQVFSNCKKLATVKLSKNLKSIPDYTFYQCIALKTISIPSAVTVVESGAFSGCTSLPSIKIPDSVKTIEYGAFKDCSALSSITIGKGVTYIAPNAFNNSKYYNTSTNWLNKVLYIGNYLIEAKDNISGACTIKNGTKCIANSAFADCKSLKSVTIPNTVVYVNDNAFSSCEGLTKVVIPSSVKVLGNYVFQGCKSLKIVSDKDTTTEIVYTPKSVTEVTYGEFSGCASVKRVVMPYGVKTIRPYAFSGCSSLTSVTIPSTVKSIGFGAFEECTALKKVTVPSSVTEIAYRSFGYAYDSETWNIIKIQGFTIEGKKGSAAQKYANDNGFKFVERKLSLATPVATSANTAKGIKVTWDKISNAETYKVYQRVYNAKTKKWGGWKEIKSTTGLSYVDTTTKVGTYYSYAVRAANDGFYSSFKATNGLKYDAKPAVTVANASNGIKVSWSTVANATGYTVYSSTYNTKTKKWSSWKDRGTTKANATSWVDKSAKAGTIYKYTVRARYGSAASSFVASANIVRLLNPTVKVVKASNGIKVTWNKIAGAKNYKVYRATYANGKWSGWSAITTTNNKTFAFTDKTAKTGVTYKYTVRAVNGKSASAFTASSNIKR